MQDSGLSDNRHNRLSNHHPVWRPKRNMRVSPINMVANAPPTATIPISEPRALAPPAINSAMAAGTGNPMVSRNTAANREFAEAVRRYERECGKTLSDDEKRRLHDAITGKGYGLKDIVQDARAIFGCPGN